MYTLYTDSDTDMTPELCEKYGYKLISMPYTLDGKTIYPYVDFKEYDYHAFYDRLRKGNPLPSTSALPPQEYINYFEPEFKAGRDILYVHFSAAMTSTFNSMRLALEELKEKYPDRKVYEIDTKGITLGSLNICLEIGEMYKQGKSIEEIMKWAEVEVDKFAIYFYVDDLKFFHRSGRVGGFSAFFGNIIGIKPIINMDENGTMQSCDKGRGKTQTFKRILNYVKELQEDMKDHRVLVGHSDCEALADEFIAAFKKEFGEGYHIEKHVVNPTAGSHCGPDGVGISFHAKHR